MRWLLTLLACSPVVAKPLALDRPDLHAHFWLSYGLALTLTEVLEGPEPRWGPQWGTTRALLVATAGVAALGLAKELTDDALDPDDLLADGLGLLANGLLQVVVEF